MHVNTCMSSHHGEGSSLPEMSVPCQQSMANAYAETRTGPKAAEFTRTVCSGKGGGQGPEAGKEAGTGSSTSGGQRQAQPSSLG